MFLILNVILLLRKLFKIYFYFTAAGVVPRGSRKKPYIIHIADYILFQSFEIRGYILTNQKILIGLESCFGSSFFNSMGQFLYSSVIESTALSILRNYSMFISDFHHQIMSGLLMRLR